MIQRIETSIGIFITNFIKSEFEYILSNLLTNKGAKIIYGYSLMWLAKLNKNNKNLLKMINLSDILTIDGKGLYFFLRLIGDNGLNYFPIPDLVNDTLKFADKKHLRVFVLGSTEENNRLACENIKQLYPKIQICGRRNGFFKKEQEQEIIAEINSHNVDILLIGLPTPQKERLAIEYKNQLNVKLIIPCGGVIDLIAGKTKREPRWLGKIGLAWFYRFIQEPKRLFKPMFFGFIKILLIIFPRIIYKKYILLRKVDIFE